MFDFFKRKKSIDDNNNEKKEVIVKELVNEDFLLEISKIKVPKYDKIEALKNLLVYNKFDDEEIESIINSKYPFDKAWKAYFMPGDSYYKEELREIYHFKLHVIEGINKLSDRGSFITSSLEYFMLCICRALEFDYGIIDFFTPEKVDFFVEKTFEKDYMYLKKYFDKDFFNCVAFYCNKNELTYNQYIDELKDCLYKSTLGYNDFCSVLGNKDDFILLITFILNTFRDNMTFSLKTIIIQNENNKIESEKVKEKIDFYDFKNIKPIGVGKQAIYVLEGENLNIALNDIKKALNILDVLKENKKIPNTIDFDINNIVLAVKYKNKEDGTDRFNTFLRYNPLTKTGKIPKNLCSLNFDINYPTELLKDGIFTCNELFDIEKNVGLGGVIYYNSDKIINKITLFFFINGVGYHIDSKIYDRESDLFELQNIDLKIDGKKID